MTLDMEFYISGLKLGLLAWFIGYGFGFVFWKFQRLFTPGHSW